MMDEIDFSATAMEVENVDKTNNSTKNESILKLICEWKDCSYTTNNSKETFYKHVSYHLPDLKVSTDEDGEEMYECLWENCSFNTKDSKHVTRHVKYHGYHTILKAKGSLVMMAKKLPICSVTDMENNSIPPLTEPFLCQWGYCLNECSGLQEMIDHIIYDHINNVQANNKKELVCNWKGCKVSASKRSKLLLHIKVHTGERDLACPQCGHAFANATKFSDHLLRQLPVDEHSFQCNYCFTYVPNERLLRGHMRQHVHHYKCNFCGMTCHTPAILKTHIKYRHMSVWPYHCTSCEYRCKTQTDLRQHLLTHTSNNKYSLMTCSEPGCEFQCSTQSTLTRHFYKEHSSDNKDGGRYSCHLCNKSYTRGNTLTRHLCSVHNVRKPPDYSRFIYRAERDGCNRLQTVRLESLQVMADMDKKDVNISSLSDEEDVDNPDEEQEKSYTEKNPKETITIDVLDETGEVILTNIVTAEDSLPPDAKVVAIGQ